MKRIARIKTIAGIRLGDDTPCYLRMETGGIVYRLTKDGKFVKAILTKGNQDWQFNSRRELLSVLSKLHNFYIVKRLRTAEILKIVGGIQINKNPELIEEFKIKRRRKQTEEAKILTSPYSWMIESISWTEYARMNRW